MHRLIIPGVLAATTLAVAVAANAQTPEQLRQTYESAARAIPGFSGFSASRGAQFFKNTHGGEWSCASCHTANPAGTGRHAKTGKTITPLAPAANPERFTAADKTEKWFRRNCNDVLNRECTPIEKGDVLAYLMSLAR
jgi:cytochrome c peroxidase